MRRKTGSGEPLTGFPARSSTPILPAIPPAVLSDLERYPRVLRTLVKERGFSQVRLGQRLGWTKPALARLLNGKETLRVDQVVSILHEVGAPADELYARLYGFPRPLPGRRTEEAARFGRQLFETHVEKHGLSSGVSALIETLIRHCGLPVGPFVAALETAGDSSTRE